MAIHVVCSHCQNRCALPEGMGGKAVKCPACGHLLAIPGGVKGKAAPPPLGAGALLDMVESELAASRSAPALSASRQRKRAPPTVIWTVLGGLSLLLLVIIFAAIFKSGCASEAPREGSTTTVTADRPWRGPV